MRDRRGHCLAIENRCNSRFLGLMPAVAVGMTVGCASNNCSRIEGLEFETHQGWYPSPTLRSGFDRDLPGPVAQRLEPAAHNGLVAGSSPARPTITNRFFVQ